MFLSGCSFVPVGPSLGLRPPFCRASLRGAAAPRPARSGVVAVCGGRSLGSEFGPLVGRVCRSLVASGRSLVVGCAVGADSFVLCSGLPVSAVRCFCAFGPSGLGACQFSAVSPVLSFAAAGGSVAWFAGGRGLRSVSAALVGRTGAVVSAASAGLVCFFASPASRGSLLACQLAASRGLSVVAFPCGFPPSALPLLGAGSWVPCGGRGVFSSGFRWVSGQASLFG